MRERDIEAYLVARVKELGGEVRKVQWVGRKSAPDRLVMMPPACNGVQGLEHEFQQSEFSHRWFCRRCADPQGAGGNTIWVELKNPETVKTFPANAHERAQHREHERMRTMGQRVEVVGTHEQIDELLR